MSRASPIRVHIAADVSRVPKVLAESPTKKQELLE